MCCASLLPDDADEDFNDALSEIEMKNIASIRRIRKDAVLTILNGSTILNGKNTSADKFYITNGSCIIYNAKECAPIKVLCNGVLIFEKGSNLDLSDINGKSVEVTWSLENCKSYSEDLEADALYISNLNDGDVVIAGHEIKFEYDVTAEMLREKDLHFIAGYKIVCNSKEVLAYAKANFIAGNSISIKEQ